MQILHNDRNGIRNTDVTFADHKELVNPRGNSRRRTKNKIKLALLHNHHEIGPEP